LVITEVLSNSAAFDAGLKKGDIIKSVNGTAITIPSELQELITRFKPGDKVTVLYSRNGKDATVTTTLKNKIGNFDIVKQDNSVLVKLGADIASLDTKKAKEYGVPGGVVVRKINDGALKDQTRMRDGFIIVKVNDTEIKTSDDFVRAIGTAKSITITGFYPGYDALFDYPISLD
jgi:S1-C subfamily serine protease